jgi:tetratricopeptide (TPR) repeat protein
MERAADPLGDAALSAAERVAEIGRVLLEGSPDGGFDAFTGATCAEALADLYTARGDRTRGEQAVALLRRVLAAAPNARAEVQRYAQLTESLGMFQESLEAWRTLLAGLDPGTGPWFEARVHHVRILARVEPSRARTVLDQHVALYPGYGPDPWGPDLRAIHQSLGAAP